ncbi:MAG: TetR/AcrR family transcriptional regulator [Betaproteobacteria bacterium]|nr:TetR/AcrR family transcriptional regulator [Betaproteobacteria bacterium]
MSRARPAGARSTPRKTAAAGPGHVQSLVTDPRLVEERRGQIVRAAVKLFSGRGYYTTTIQEIAREAGISTGLVYQYVRDKDDVLLLALKLVLDTYEREIPARLIEVEGPVRRLCTAIATYCEIIDRLREATVLTYRSTKSLRDDRRRLIMDGEVRTNRIIQACVHSCVKAGQMRTGNEYLHAYMLVMFCHTWALKYWALRKRYTLARYVRDGLDLLVAPLLTAQGRVAYAAALADSEQRRKGTAR